jgi:hypothetical protein
LEGRNYEQKKYCLPVTKWALNQQVIYELVKCLSLSNPLGLCSVYFPGQLGGPEGINKDPDDWFDRARPLPGMFSKIIRV